jgi:hypothetical protein
MQSLEVITKDLDWKVKNEQHWFMSTCDMGEHRLIIHNAFGPIFPWHEADVDTMCMEANFLPRENWGCHYFARWWAGESEFWACDVATDAEGMAHMTFHTRKVEKVVALTTLPASAFFLTRLIRIRTPIVSVRWVGRNKCLDK